MEYGDADNSDILLQNKGVTEEGITLRRRRDIATSDSNGASKHQVVNNLARQTETAVKDPQRDIMSVAEENINDDDQDGFTGPITLLNAPPTFKPMKYTWAFEAWKKQQEVIWLPYEVPMSRDINDWHNKLTDNERHLLTQIFRFFTQSDIEVFDCCMTYYAQIFKPNEIKMMLSAFANMETIHIAAYAHLMESINMPEAEYSAFLKFEEMKNKYDYMKRFCGNSKRDVAITLAAFGAFTEGLQLFSSFAILLNFQRFNKMTGMCQIVTWSIRDETLHTESIIRLFRTFIAENPELWTEDFKSDLYEICATIVHFEDAFIDLAFKLGGIEGLIARDVKKYIRYLADRRLLQLGLREIYLVDENPLKWMDMIVGVENTNFFEGRVTEYSRASTEGTWDEAFAIHDEKEDDDKQ